MLLKHADRHQGLEGPGLGCIEVVAADHRPRELVGTALHRLAGDELVARPIHTCLQERGREGGRVCSRLAAGAAGGALLHMQRERTRTQNKFGSTTTTQPQWCGASDRAWLETESAMGTANMAHHNTWAPWPTRPLSGCAHATAFQVKDLGENNTRRVPSCMLKRVQKSTNVYCAQKQQKCMCPHMIVHMAVPGPQIF